jgi:Uncharacterized protein conserved in bacteria (DUF2332)
MAKIVGMPGPAAGSAVPERRARTLAQVYRHFGEVDAAGTSPLYEHVAVALSESGEALRAIEAAPARRRHPTVILAALHDLADPLAGLLVVNAVLGLVSIIAAVLAWRSGNRMLIGINAAALIINAITALPGIFVHSTAFIAFLSAAISLVTVLAVVLMLRPGQRPAAVTD